MTPHLNCQEGDTVYVRATVVQAASDFFEIRIEDYPNWVVKAHVPVSEVAKAEDISGLRMQRRRDLKYLEMADDGVNAQKLPK
jgi:hypothetical protein